MTNLDLNYLNKKGIKLISLKGESEVLDKISTTAEHAWMLFLLQMRDYKKAHENIMNGSWKRSNLKIQQLRGKEIFIIGYGRIGKMIESYAESFGMKVFLNDIKIPQSNKLNQMKFVSLDEGLSRFKNIFLCASVEDNKTPILDKKK